MAALHRAHVRVVRLRPAELRRVDFLYTLQLPAYTVVCYRRASMPSSEPSSGIKTTSLRRRPAAGEASGEGHRLRSTASTAVACEVGVTSAVCSKAIDFSYRMHLHEPTTVCAFEPCTAADAATVGQWRVAAMPETTRTNSPAAPVDAPSFSRLKCQESSHEHTNGIRF